MCGSCIYCTLEFHSTLEPNTREKRIIRSYAKERLIIKYGTLKSNLYSWLYTIRFPKATAIAINRKIFRDKQRGFHHFFLHKQKLFTYKRSAAVACSFAIIINLSDLLFFLSLRESLSSLPI